MKEIEAMTDVEFEQFLYAALGKRKKQRNLTTEEFLKEMDFHKKEKAIIEQEREVLREKAAHILGILYAYEKAHQLDAEDNPIRILHKQIWNLKEDVLNVSKAELLLLNAQLSFLLRYVEALPK